MGEFLWVSDNDLTLGEKHKLHDKEVDQEIINLLEEFDINFVISTGKPIEYAFKEYLSQLFEMIKEQNKIHLLDKIGLTGSNGALTWLGFNEDLSPKKIIEFGLENEDVLKAVGQVHLLTEYLLDKFGVLIKEQINAEVNGRRIVGSVSRVTKDCDTMPMRYLGKREVNVPHSEFEENPGAKEFYDEAINFIEENELHSIKLFPHTDTLDIVPKVNGKGLDKSYAVKKVLEIIGEKKVIASGDHLNDLDLFEMGDYSMAPRNSHPEIIINSSHFAGDLEKGFPFTGLEIVKKVREIVKTQDSKY